MASFWNFSKWAASKDSPKVVRRFNEIGKDRYTAWAMHIISKHRYLVQGRAGTGTIRINDREEEFYRGFVSYREITRSELGGTWWDIHDYKMDSLMHEAYHYANERIEDEFYIWSGGKIAQLLLSVFYVVLSIASVILTAGTGTWIVAGAWANLIVSLGTTIWEYTGGDYYANQARQQANELQATQRQRSLLKNANDAEDKRRSDQLTNTLITNPYAMQANGQLYTAQAPGREGFNFTKAYNPTDAINGDFATVEIDDSIQNRGHRHLAGNADYHRHLLQDNNALAIRPHNHKQAQDILIQTMKNRSSKIANLMTELNDSSKGRLGHFGKRVKSHEQRTNYISDYIEQLLKLKVDPYKNNFWNNDVLEKLKSYSEGKRADFNYQFIKLQAKTDIEKTAALRDHLRQLAEARQNLANSPEAQAVSFVRSMHMALEHFAEQEATKQAWDFARYQDLPLLDKTQYQEHYRDPTLPTRRDKLIINPLTNQPLKEFTIKTVVKPKIAYSEVYGKKHGIADTPTYYGLGYPQEIPIALTDHENKALLKPTLKDVQSAQKASDIVKLFDSLMQRVGEVNYTKSRFDIPPGMLNYYIQNSDILLPVLKGKKIVYIPDEPYLVFWSYTSKYSNITGPSYTFHTHRRIRAFIPLDEAYARELIALWNEVPFKTLAEWDKLTEGIYG